MELNKLLLPVIGLVAASGLVMQYQTSTSSPVATTSRATFLGTATPPGTNYVPSDLSMTVTALPPNGTVLLADGFTPVRPRQVLTLAQLEALKFRPALSSTAGSQASGSSTTNPAGEVVEAEARLPAGYSVLSVPEGSGARTIGIQISADTDHPAAGSCAIITGLPSNGSVLLADGTTVVTQGQTLTAAQLKRLRFRPAADATGQISDLSYLAIRAAGSALAGCVLLIVAPATLPLSATTRRTPAPAAVAERSSAGSAGAALLDAYRSSTSSSKLISSVQRTDDEGKQDGKNMLQSGVDIRARRRERTVKRTSIGNGRRPRNVLSSRSGR